MQPIILTNRDKKKLLVMAKTLFPEYIFQNWMDIQYGAGHETEACWTLRFSENGGLVTTIHWVEFCTTKLAWKISELHDAKNKQLLESGILRIRLEAWENRFYLQFWHNFNFGWCKKPLVEYLYTEFKKLSK